MNRKRSLVQYAWMLLTAMVIISSSAFGQEPMALIPRLEILTPGMTRTISITQESPFPQGMSQFLVLIIGSGPFAISISPEKVAEDNLLVLSGFGISSAGFFPFLKWGYTEVSYNVGIEIGDERFPCGIVLFSCWLQDPEEPSTYNLKISF